MAGLQGWGGSSTSRGWRLDRPFRAIHRWLGRVARRRGLAVALVTVLAFAAGATLSLLRPRVPQPHIHDDFGYLLIADTFVHGRLTNPTHPLWVHFESMHVIQRPTYTGKYPVGQALLLAAGQVACGIPLAGAWLGVALACGALCWMLMAWVPPRWALLGGLIAVAHPTLALQWSQSYTNGAVAACGGALLLGALRRLLGGVRARDGLVLGLAFAVLANSRPFEGLVLSVLVLAALAAWGMGQAGLPARVWAVRVALPVALVLGPTAAAMALYNARVAGRPLRLPYMVHEAEYAASPLFLWQSPRPALDYRHAVIRRFHTEWELPQYLGQMTVRGALRHARIKLADWFGAYWPPLYLKVTLSLLPVPLLALPWVLRDRWMRLALGLLVAFLATLLVSTTWMLPHYAAPATGLIFVLELQAMRQFRLWRWRGRPLGRWALRAILAFYFASFAVRYRGASKFEWTGGITERAGIAQSLERSGGRHLVLVRYAPDHNYHEEWVYNGAAIDGSPVVWAREMDPAHNRELVDYFRGRRAWLLEPDARPLKLVPYPD